MVRVENPRIRFSPDVPGGIGKNGVEKPITEKPIIRLNSVPDTGTAFSMASNVGDMEWTIQINAARRQATEANGARSK